MRNLFYLVFILFLSCTPSNELNGGFTERLNKIVYREANQFPLRVYIDDDISDPSVDYIRKAARAWNKEVERLVFVTQVTEVDYIEPHCGSVVLSFDDIHNDEHNKREAIQAYHVAESTNNNKNVYCVSYIYFDTELENSWVYWVALHEFGHALCLTHDKNDSRSIMYPVVVGTDMPKFIMPDDAYHVRKMIDGELKHEYELKCHESYMGLNCLN